MGIKGIALSETKDFISSFDKDEPKTIWKIGPLDSEIFNLVGEDKNPLRLMSDAVRFGLKGIENFKDERGNIVKFDTINKAVGPYSYKVVSDVIMKIIPPQVKNELGAEILKISNLDEEEAKN